MPGSHSIDYQRQKTHFTFFVCMYAVESDHYRGKFKNKGFNDIISSYTYVQKCMTFSTLKNILMI